MADQNVIKDAYRKLSKRIHPDVNENDKFFEEYFKKIQEAYESLSHEKNRRAYDATYSNETTSQGELDNLKYHIHHLENINRELNSQLWEIKSEKNLLNNELEDYKNKYFNLKSRAEFANNKTEPENNRVHRSSKNVKESEINLMGWLLIGIFVLYVIFIYITSKG